MAKRSATGVTSGVGTPFRLDGFNGDMTIRTSSQGKKLYVKDFNKWHGINLNIDTLKMKNDVDKLLKDTKKLTINKRRRPLFDSAYFRVGGSATVQLKNVGAVLKVRNLADDADAAINASTGTFMTSIELGHATDTTLERASTGEVNINSNRIYRAGGTDVAVTDGGTGVGDLTDGGILLGSGTSAITATAALGDGEMIVGDGSTDPAIESGTDLRTSIGVGTTDTPTFAEATLSKAYNAIADATSLIITPAITSRSAGSSGQTMNAIKINPTLDADSAAGGTQTFNAVLVNVTETDLTGFDAVNLMDLQIGGTSKLKVNNTGAITSTGTASGSAESTAADTRYLMMNASTGLVGFRTAGEIKSDSALATVDGSFSSLNVTSTTAPQATIAYQADEHLTVSVANNGVTTLATSDNAGTSLADLTLDVDGDITLDSASGVFIMKGPGIVPEFSVAKSAYAGMILGYRMIGEDASAGSYRLTTSFVVPADALGVRFIAPPSGTVEIMCQIFVDSITASSTYIGLSTADYSTGYASAGATYEQNMGEIDETDNQVQQHFWVVSGLTAGTAYNRWVGFKREAGLGASDLIWGGTSSGDNCDFILKVTALPEATSNTAEYD